MSDSDQDFNPQPEPPGASSDFNPQPEPPGADSEFNPQPEPPGVAQPDTQEGEKGDGLVIEF
jgi:hypothetical protein